MGLRFRRSFKIAPGLRINLSRSGVSTSIGTRGAHVTIGHGQVRETVGIPGTGISYTEVKSTPAASSGIGAPANLLATAWNVFFLLVVLGAVFLLAYACTSILQ